MPHIPGDPTAGHPDPRNPVGSILEESRKRGPKQVTPSPSLPAQQAPPPPPTLGNDEIEAGTGLTTGQASPETQTSRRRTVAQQLIDLILANDPSVRTEPQQVQFLMSRLGIERAEARRFFDRVIVAGLAGQDTATPTAREAREREIFEGQERAGSQFLQRGVADAFGRPLSTFSPQGQSAFRSLRDRFNNQDPILSFFRKGEPGAGFTNFLQRGGSTPNDLSSRLDRIISRTGEDQALDPVDQQGIAATFQARFGDPNAAAFAAIQPLLASIGDPRERAAIAGIIIDQLGLASDPLAFEGDSLGLMRQLFESTRPNAFRNIGNAPGPAAPLPSVLSPAARGGGQLVPR